MVTVMWVTEIWNSEHQQPPPPQRFLKKKVSVTDVSFLLMSFIIYGILAFFLRSGFTFLFNPINLDINSDIWEIEVYFVYVLNFSDQFKVSTMFVFCIYKIK